MRRRTLLTSIAAIGSGLLAWRVGFGSDEDAIARVLHKRLCYLRLDPHGVDAFAKDMATRDRISKFRLRLISAAGPLYTIFNPPEGGRLDRLLRHGEDRIVTQYLMSSDFFKNGADKTRVVCYLGYYDPLVACNNPFACRPPDTGA